MSMTADQFAILQDNEHYSLLGHSGDAFFVRLKCSGSVAKLCGKPASWMLSLVAPRSWWSSFGFVEHPGRGAKLTAAMAFVLAAQRKGAHDEQRRIADEKRAAQPAPVLTESGLPAAFILSETATHSSVKCPFCGDVHVHGAPLLGPRVPHCRPLYLDIGDYELVRRSVAVELDKIKMIGAE